MGRTEGTAPAPNGAEAAHADDSLPECGKPCNDLAEAICEDCESPVKGRDCDGWRECLKEADAETLPCRFCQPVTPRARALRDARDLLRAEGERNHHEIGAVSALIHVLDLTMATLRGAAERLGAR